MSDWEAQAAKEECDIRARLQLLDPLSQSLEYADVQIEEEHQWMSEGWTRGSWSWVPRPQPGEMSLTCKAMGAAAEGMIYQRSKRRLLFHPILPSWVGPNWIRSNHLRNRWRNAERDSLVFRLSLSSAQYLTMFDSNVVMREVSENSPGLPPWVSPTRAMQLLHDKYPPRRPPHPLHPLECIDRAL
eukprot:10800852-Alexandrium_andersonii.AAC.1